MVTKATPIAALVVAEAELLFEFQPILPRVGASDARAPFGAVDEMLERGIGVAIGEPELGGFGFTVGSVGAHGQLRPGLTAPIAPLRGFWRPGTPRGGPGGCGQACHATRVHLSGRGTR